ncbi:MAG: leucine-rich repeat protein [Candidatus Thorarchaeota archaeon]
MGIQLCYTDTKRNEHRLEFESGVTEIDLSYHRIASIDLTPLRSLTNLLSLDLHRNAIEQIDLSPLDSCVNLQNLNLAQNRIQTINLISLGSCVNLQKLTLAENSLRTVSLAPLSSKVNLQILSLAANQLETIKLSPINSCTSLQYLGLWHNNLQNIDLSPLINCSSLEKIHLHENQLQIIDLTPLNSNNKIRELALSDNQLETIDLTPLAAHTGLTKLFLYNNSIKTIDLSPLSSCSNLEMVTLRGNKLSDVDLTPFASCPSLRFLVLRGNPLIPLDVTPLTGDPVIDFETLGTSWLRRRNMNYQRPAKNNPWSFLYQVAQHHKSNLRVQHEILYALNLENYGFIDCDLTEILCSISPETPTEEAREQIAKLLAVEIMRVVDAGGTTTGLELEGLIIKHAEIASRAQRIIELRENEMKNVVIGVNGDRRDLRELWLTAYGYKILTALNMKDFSYPVPDYVKILRALEKIGYRVKEGYVEDSRINMSRQLRESILWIVKQKGKPWSKILE